MQKLPRSVAARPHGEGLLSRLFRIITRQALAERPGIPWAQIKAFDFEGEDASLTQKHLDLLR